jgi:para-aminobenzoate synthetase component I
MSQWQSYSLPYKEDTALVFENFYELEHSAYLDSSAPFSTGRFDIIAALPYQVLRFKDGTTSLEKEGSVRYFDLDPLTFLDSLLPRENDPLLKDVPFFNGAIGYISYDYGNTHFNLNATKSGLSEVFFAFYRWAVVVCHQKKTATLYVANGALPVDIDDIQRRWTASLPRSQPFRLLTPFKPKTLAKNYKNKFEEIQTHLRQGDAYQVNFTHSFGATYSGSPFSAYRRIRKKNPMPYAAFISTGEADILCFSPELFISAQGSHCVTKPIKGTMARSEEKGGEADQLIAKRLLNCPKNRAENVMIVDLMRNDLSQVCKPFSVKVPALWDLESYSTVHHLVSTVTGELKEGLRHIDLIKALFPGGSITGAPKLATMKIINKLEDSPRGVYCGSIGYFSANNKCQFNIAIRTMVASFNQIECYGGGGIVIDSVDEVEYQETYDKISILTKTLEEKHETIDLPSVPKNTTGSTAVAEANP